MGLVADPVNRLMEWPLFRGVSVPGSWVVRRLGCRRRTPELPLFPLLVCTWCSSPSCCAVTLEGGANSQIWNQNKQIKRAVRAVRSEIKIKQESSCVNARGIPTAAYEVFHMLSYPQGAGGVGTLDGGGGRYLEVPPPPRWSQDVGVGTLDWGGRYLGWGGRYLGRGVGTLDRGGRYLGQGVGTLDGGGGVGTLGYPLLPPGVDKLTNWNYYLPLILRMRSVIKWNLTFRVR